MLCDGGSQILKYGNKVEISPSASFWKLFVAAATRYSGLSEPIGR